MRVITAAAAIAASAVVLSACSGEAAPKETKEAIEPSGTITHLTHLDPARFEPYVEAFLEKYPEVENVEVQRLTDYPNEIKTRMSTDDYGDVLGIPASVTPDQLPDFFEPLGDREEMLKTYRWLNKSFEDVVYGLPDLGNAQGLLYNKKLWEGAGITEFPTTPDEFIRDLKKIKAEYPEVTPLVTNYKDGWMLSQWEGYRGIPSNNPDVTYDMTTWSDPWGSGNDYEVIDGLLYDVAAAGLIEPDPTTATYDETKILIGAGTIATMPVGSWAVFRAGGDIEKAGYDADDIGYMPFPVQHDGKFYATTGPDVTMAVSLHSDNKVTARAWLDFLVGESTYSEDLGGLSPRIDGSVPAVLEDFVSQVELFSLNPLPVGKETLWADISNASGIVLNDGRYRQELIDAARTGSKSKEQLFDELNAAWEAGRQDVLG
nr:extracellular solute-binding protein [Microbacterium immunditiarum]